MASLNQCTLIGNVTRDPELKHLPSGTAVAEFGLAMNRTYKTQGGEKQEEVTFVDVKFFGPVAQNVVDKYVRRGKPLCVVGRLKQDQWTAQDGSKRSKLYVIGETLQLLGGRDGARNEADDHSERDYSGPSTAKSDRDDFEF